jgi:hypothetical protein
MKFRVLCAAVMAASSAASLSGCATPVTMLQNGDGQVVRCGGGMAGSMAAGYIGYSLEKGSDEQCVRDYEARGYRRTGAQPAAIQAQEPQGPVAQTSQVLRPIATKAPPPPQGQFGIEAAKTAREAKCAAFDTSAQFVAKGAGYETYSVACISGDTMMVRCEFGTCCTLR